MADGDVEVGPPIKPEAFLRAGFALAEFGSERVAQADRLVRAASDGTSKIAKLESAATDGWTICQKHCGTVPVPLVNPKTGKHSLSGVALCCYRTSYSPEAIASRKSDHEAQARALAEEEAVRSALEAEANQLAAWRSEVDARISAEAQDRPDPGAVDSRAPAEVRVHDGDAESLRLDGPDMAEDPAPGTTPQPSVGEEDDEFGSWLRRTGVA